MNHPPIATPTGFKALTYIMVNGLSGLARVVLGPEEPAQGDCCTGTTSGLTLRALCNAKGIAQILGSRSWWLETDQ